MAIKSKEELLKMLITPSSQRHFLMYEALRKGATVEEISRAEVEFDGDDGKATYEIEFIKDGIEYEYTVDAITGEILDVETELDDEDDDDDDDDDDMGERRRRRR